MRIFLILIVLTVPAVAQTALEQRVSTVIGQCMLTNANLQTEIERLQKELERLQKELVKTTEEKK